MPQSAGTPKCSGLPADPSLEFWAMDGGPLTVQDSANTVHIALFERAPQPNRATIALRTSAAGLHDWFTHLQASGHCGWNLKTMRFRSRSTFRTRTATPYEITTYEHAVFAARAVMPITPLKRNANGRPPSPVWRYALCCLHQGPVALQPSPA